MIRQRLVLPKAVVHSKRSERPHRAADSTGRRNTLSELLCGLEVIQGLSGSVVEFAGDGIEMLLGVHGEVRAFREVLAQETVSVLIGAALPRAVGISEVDVEIGRQGQALVIGQFLASVPCQRLAKFSG